MLTHTDGNIITHIVETDALITLIDIGDAHYRLTVIGGSYVSDGLDYCDYVPVYGWTFCHVGDNGYSEQRVTEITDYLLLDAITENAYVTLIGPSPIM